jgi:hypothetical protein
MDRFEAKYVEEPNTGCFIWCAAVGSHGYGVFALGGGKTTTAPRHSFERSKGSVPKGLHVLHHCDNRLCVNPDHLYAGTNSENALDAWRRSRPSGRGKSGPTRKREYSGEALYASVQGGKNCQAKLTTEQVAAIRADRRYRADTKLAKEYGISRAQVYRIKRGIRWSTEV